MGSHRYPVLGHKLKLKQAPDASVQEGGSQINYEDQDPRIHEIWLRELAAAGVASRMGKYFDEDRIRRECHDSSHDAGRSEIPARSVSRLDQAGRHPHSRRLCGRSRDCGNGAWPRLGDGCRGAFVHLDGRGDWMTVFLLDVPPGGASAPQRHLYDEVFYVLSGTGSMVVEMPDGGQHTFDFGPRSLFAPPLNARYRIVNGSGREPVRLACVNDLRILMNLFHDEAFFFDNPFAFPERQGNPEPVERELDRRACLRNSGRHLSEGAAQRRGPPHRLRSRCRLHAALACGHAATSSASIGDPACASRCRKTCFISTSTPAPNPRAISPLGSAPTRYPIVCARRLGAERTDGSQIEHADQDPRIHALWLEELRKAGVRSEMTHGLPLHSRLA